MFLLLAVTVTHWETSSRAPSCVGKSAPLQTLDLKKAGNSELQAAKLKFCSQNSTVSPMFFGYLLYVGHRERPQGAERVNSSVPSRSSLSPRQRQVLINNVKSL